MDIANIKQKLDIITVAESYGFEFKGAGKANRLRASVNLFRDENTSSLDFFIDTQRFFDRGNASIKGDVIDVISRMENISNKEALIKANEMVGKNYTYTKREPIRKNATVKQEKNIDFEKYKQQATKELQSVLNLNPICIFQKQDANDAITDEYIILDKRFEKLFEGLKFSIDLERSFKYLFKNIIGWSDFWQSPTIILKDNNGRVVDLVAYRPKDKETNAEIEGMKYYYKNFSDRGNNFLFPFQKEVETIIAREKYIIIGEGLKNALNALIYGVPFISIESTGNTLKLNDNFIAKIKSYIDNGYGVATAFDGDKSGKEAYNNFLKLLGFEVENILNFDSNQDFVEYLKAN